MEYLLDLGLEPVEIYRCMMWMSFSRYFEDQLDLMGDDHIGSSSDNPIRDNAFGISALIQIIIITLPPTTRNVDQK